MGLADTCSESLRQCRGLHSWLSRRYENHAFDAVQSRGSRAESPAMCWGKDVLGTHIYEEHREGGMPPPTK